MSVVNPTPSAALLAKITDEGFFEQLATAILREADSAYRPLVQTGVNLKGKTRKSPVDAICFEEGADPPHLIAVHHTTCAETGLERKWLHKPETVKPRKAKATAANPGKGKPTTDPGDLLKTAYIVREERLKHPNLKATLILTTNEEPSESLVRAANLAAADATITLHIWSRTRLAEYLDNTPRGQWLRKKYLGVEQELLSEELFHQLCEKNLELYAPPEGPKPWVSRKMDQNLANSSVDPIRFLVAASGMGKSVACYKWLSAHVNDGGFGLVIPADIVAEAASVEQAVAATLKRLHPTLSENSGPSLSIPTRPLFLVVEDINRSGQSKTLIEKIAGWNPKRDTRQPDISPPWRLICPVWPELLVSMSDQLSKRIGAFVIIGEAFTSDEARQAVKKRAELRSEPLSDLVAEEIAGALGNDPLLIALHDQCAVPKVDDVIEGFIDSALVRTASDHNDYTAGDYMVALRSLARGMLKDKCFEPTWADAGRWTSGAGQDEKKLLSHVAHRGEIIRLSGPATSQTINFRHDRVRDWLLSDAIADMERSGTLDPGILSEPFYAEVLGAGMLRPGIGTDLVDRMLNANPLALFYALRLFGEPTATLHTAVINAINSWVDDPQTKSLSFFHARQDALTVLSQTDSKVVISIARKFPEQLYASRLARLRNGDLTGAIELCIQIEPGIGAVWRDKQIENMKLRFGQRLAKALESVLLQSDLDPNIRIGALRLAGHLSDAMLAESIKHCWNDDTTRKDHLGDYLWAFAQCCGANAELYLAPVCDAWSSLSDAGEQKWLSPRYSLASHEVRWAFQKWVPVDALDYLIERSQQEELHEPLTHLLQALDDAKTVEYTVKCFAEERRNAGHRFVFTGSGDDWRHAQESGRPMSTKCRALLAKIWQGDSNEKFMRLEAFYLWAATVLPEDIAVLRSATSDDIVGDVILRQRLRRGDREAVPHLAEKLRSADRQAWLWDAQYVWCDELNTILDEMLQDRKGGEDTDSSNENYMLSYLVMLTKPADGEQLLLKHWEALSPCAQFFQAALYLSTPGLRERAAAIVAASPTPVELFKHIGSHWGIGIQNRPGLTRLEQILTLIPYLDFLDNLDIHKLWEECNDHGWLAVRKEHLDERLLPPFDGDVWDETKQKERLDDLSKRNFPFIDRWIDDKRKARITWEEIASFLSKWLTERKTIDVLSVVSSALLYAGRRQDLQILRMDIPDVRAIMLVQDTQYAVRRRTLS